MGEYLFSGTVWNHETVAMATREWGISPVTDWTRKYWEEWEYHLDDSASIAGVGLEHEKMETQVAVRWMKRLINR